MNENKIFKQKYILEKNDIIALNQLPDNLSERKKSLGWPIEIQGTGRIKEGLNNFEIQYPKGDIFLSFAVVVHELGHLRQEEFNNEINKIDQKKDWISYIEIKEKDAYKRGFERLKQYFPEELSKIEEKFKCYRSKDELSDFSTFEDLYEFLNGTIDINRAINSIPGMDDKNEQDKLEYEALKNIGIEKFFKKINKSRVDEIIDQEWVEGFMLKMAKKIANE